MRGDFRASSSGFRVQFGVHVAQKVLWDAF